MEVTGVEDGSYSYAARATDAANNISPASNYRTVTVDTELPPTPVINKPADNTYNTTGNVTVSGTAEAGSIVEIFDGESTEPLDEVQVNVYGRWKIWLTEVADGTHSYKVKSTDAAAIRQVIPTPVRSRWTRSAPRLRLLNRSLTRRLRSRLLAPSRRPSPRR